VKVTLLNPDTDVPGCSPTSPPIVVGPVFVTVEPARTAKLFAVPRLMVACAAPDVEPVAIKAIDTATTPQKVITGRRRLDLMT
jgi:hypothetical protein